MLLIAGRGASHYAPDRLKLKTTISGIRAMKDINDLLRSSSGAMLLSLVCTKAPPWSCGMLFSLVCTCVSSVELWDAALVSLYLRLFRGAVGCYSR